MPNIAKAKIDKSNPTDKKCITCFYLLNQEDCYFHKGASYCYTNLGLPKPQTSNEPTVQHRQLFQLMVTDSILHDSVNEEALLRSLEANSFTNSIAKSKAIRSNDPTSHHELLKRLEIVYNYSKPYGLAIQEIPTSELTSETLSTKVDSLQHSLSSLMAQSQSYTNIAPSTKKTDSNIELQNIATSTRLEEMSSNLNHFNSDLVKLSEKLNDTIRSVRLELSHIQLKLKTPDKTSFHNKSSSTSSLKSEPHTFDKILSESQKPTVKPTTNKQNNPSINLLPQFQKAKPSTNNVTTALPATTTGAIPPTVPTSSRISPSEEIKHESNESEDPDNSESEDIDNSEEEERHDPDLHHPYNKEDDNDSVLDDNSSILSSESKSAKPTDRKSNSPENIRNWIDYLYDRSDKFYTLSAVPKNYKKLTDSLYEKYIKHSDNSKPFKQAIISAIDKDIKNRLKKT